MSKDWLKTAPTRALTTTGASKHAERGLTSVRDEVRKRFGSPEVQQRFRRHMAMMLLDGSSSMAGEDKLQHAKSGVVEFANKANALGYEVGLVVFNCTAELLLPPCRDTAQLRAVLRPVTATGGTNLTAALSLSLENLTANGLRAAVVATDGYPNDRPSALAVALEMKNAGIRIITIGTPDADQAFLRELASASDLASVVTNAELQRAIAASATRLLLPSANPRR